MQQFNPKGENYNGKIMSDVKDVFITMPKKYLFKDGYMAVLGNSISIMKKMKSGSIDLIFADPPYNLGKEFERKLQKKQYIKWCKKWIDECMRLLKDTGSFYFMAATQFMPYLDSYVDRKYDVLSRIVWYYDSSGVQAKKMFGSMYEPILLLVKDKKKYIFNSEDVKVEAKTGSIRKLIDYRKTPPQPYNGKKVMGNVWRINRVRYRMSEYESHPTQKPERLMEIIIKASSNKNDIILDPFAGSFTTCAVAKRLSRNCIGIEKQEEYFKIGIRRLQITNEYNGERLEKVKQRKTNNKSKRDHYSILNSVL